MIAVPRVRSPLARATARGYGRGMADEEREQRDALNLASAEPGVDEEEDALSTPFDHPFFLPVVLWGFAVWFVWDAWIVPMEEHLKFNQYGSVILLVAAVYYTVHALRERRAWDCPQCGEKNPHDSSLCGKCGGAPD